MPKQVFILKGSGSLAWAYFTIAGEKAEVVALLGATTYIDRDMPLEEARKTYRKLLNQGWQTWEDAGSAMSLDKLRFWIYN